MLLLSCADCDRVYKSKNAFRSHRRTHDGTAPRCLPCNKGFASAADLRRHLDSGVHAGIRQHVCQACGMAFTKLSHLTRHTRQQHEGTMTPEDRCDHCPMRLDTQFRPLKVCRYHAVETGVIPEPDPGLAPCGSSRAACKCFDALESALGVKISHVHFGSDTAGRQVVTGREVEGLIPGRKSRPDGVCAERPNHVYEFLGNPWHGYPPEDADKHRHGRSHTGRAYDVLYTETMARLMLFRDHGYIVHYIWQHEFAAANKNDAREMLAVVHVLNPYDGVLPVL